MTAYRIRLVEKNPRRKRFSREERALGLDDPQNAIEGMIDTMFDDANEVFFKAAEGLLQDFTPAEIDRGWKDWKGMDPKLARSAHPVTKLKEFLADVYCTGL